MSDAAGEAPPLASSTRSPETAVDIFVQRLPASSRLLVAFSGGGDSTGLLALLSAARRSRPDLVLHAATVDHGLRSGAADEARAAARVCGRFGVPHVILTWTGTKPSTGIQAAARRARYGLLAAEAARIGADLVVTGHTADDQRETLAMRRARDPEATAGMDEAVLVERRVWVLRPLLAVDRASIRDYLRRRGLSWSEDPSNDNSAFERVRVRQAGELPDLPSRPRDRKLDAAAARLARDALRVHPGPVAEIALDRLGREAGADRALLGALVAVLGGRSHGPGRAAMDRIAAKLASGESFRLAAGRVVIDRRRDRLYLCREARELPDIRLEPGRTVDWDGRFEITNRGTDPARIAAGPDLSHCAPLLPILTGETLPKGVARRAGASMPRVVDGDPALLGLRPMLAPYEHFLVFGRFELAQALATAFGLEQFPPMPLGIGAF